MINRFVHITPRLMAACDMLHNSDCIADIGCDHGRLTMSLLQSGICSRVVATDVSTASLNKAKMLAAITGLSDRIIFREGDGFSVLEPGVCDAAALLGMGGTLMARLMDASDPRALGISRFVFQPMRAFSDIRRYLHQNRYHITDDRVICEGRRLYQVFHAVASDTVQAFPEGWPDEFFDLGFVSFQNEDPNLGALASRMLVETRKRLFTARGTAGETKLVRRESALAIICREVQR